MRIGIHLHKRKDTGADFVTVRYRINDGKFRKFYATKIKVNPKYWLKKHVEVSELHPAFQDVNKLLQDLKSKKFEAEQKFKDGRFTRQQVINFMSGKSDYSGLMAYNETVLKDKKSDQNYVYLRSCIRSFESTLGIEVTFEELIANGYNLFEDYFNACKKRIKADEFSASSYNSYIKGIGIVCSHAHKNKAIYDEIKIPKEFVSIDTDELEIRSFTTDEIKDRIENVESIYDLKAISMWLLLFSLRGMYPSDIATMRDKNIEDGKRNKTARKLTSWWNDEQYIFHKRAKTGVKMLIKLHRTPVLSLLQMVKNIIVYLDYPNANRQDVIASINNRVEIYNYEPINDTKFHKNLWKRTADKLRLKFDGLVFKSARKSYSTAMKKMVDEKYSSEDISLQLGQSCKYLLDNHYVNYRDDELRKVVNDTHLKVLNYFKVDELYQMLAAKLKAIILREKMPKWLMGHSGVHKVGREYKILVGMADKLKPVWEKIDPNYRNYFMNDESKSPDFWKDIKAQEEAIFGAKSEREATLKRVYKALKHPSMVDELMQKNKENKQLKDLLTKEGITAPS